MDLHAWGQQRAQYSRARHGRNERGASLVECALIQGITQAMQLRGVTRPLTTVRASGVEQTRTQTAA
ncbi:MAG TPA: hypothetical protein VHH09_05995 [Acidimicrobiales bacterium]|nr:hypothetical protein [Acidimicrobiales bacterium]